MDGRGYYNIPIPDGYPRVPLPEWNPTGLGRWNKRNFGMVAGSPEMVQPTTRPGPVAWPGAWLPVPVVTPDVNMNRSNIEQFGRVNAVPVGQRYEGGVGWMGPSDFVTPGARVSNGDGVGNGQKPAPIIENGNGDINIINDFDDDDDDDINPEIRQQVRDLAAVASSLRRVVVETVEEELEREMASKRVRKDVSVEAAMNAHTQQETGLGAGNVADAFEKPAVHSVEDAAAQTNQAEILDANELTELEKYEHPLKNEWVAGLPPYDGDLKPGEACVRDCKERVRIHDLECDEVRRRVVAKLKEMGCPSTAVAIPQKNMCS